MAVGIRLTPLVTALAVGCTAASADDRATPEISVELNRTPQVVEVRGLDHATLGRLGQLKPDDSAWSGRMAVYVEGGTSDSTPTPPIIGRYSVSGDRVRFAPRFPFADGVAYRVEVDTTRLRSRASGGLLTHRFALPSVARARTTRVMGVYPSATRLPSNLLRWYVELSAPMEPGTALQHVHLMDESGREVTGAFLALDQELWDPERRRLTLLFDPGRVKRGVRTNIESGAPLVAGRRYRLVIDAGWTDGSGAPLASGFEHAFEVADADRTSPDPNRWRLATPTAGTRAPLQVAFGEPLDHALAARLLTVLDVGGTPVPGSVALAEGDTAWMFIPERAWQAGDYSIRVGGTLEDLAGNNVVRVFDVDRRANSAGVDRDVAGTTRSIPVRVRE